MKPGIYISKACSFNEFCDAELMVFELLPHHVEMIKDVKGTIAELENKYGAWSSIEIHAQSARMLVLTTIYGEEDRSPFPGLTISQVEEICYGDVQCAYVGETWDWEVPDDNHVWRCECEGFKVYRESLYVTAIGKNSAIDVESVDIESLMFPEEVRGPAELDPEIAQAIKDGAPIKEEIGVTVGNLKDIKKSKFT